jgi:hypothetical protein
MGTDMLQILRTKATKKQIDKSAEDLQGYIKIVVDIDRKILCAGGERQVDGEQMLLADGSRQSTLWGGGFDTETKETDYNSMINLRPADNNPSREILSESIRKQFDTIVSSVLW